MQNHLAALKQAEQAAAAGDLGTAEACYRQILAAAPRELAALQGLAMLALRAGYPAEAEPLLRQALEVQPRDPSLYNALNLVLRQLKRPREAVACCQSALALAPHLPELHNNLGLALKDDGQLESAVASLERAIQFRPHYADAYYNLANTLVLLRQLDAAERAFRQAIALEPRDWEPHNNLGSLLQLQARLDEAGVCFDQALTLQPRAAEAHRNRAMLRLLRGDYARGWPEHEWRWRMPGITRPRFTQPFYQGEPLAGRTLLLCAEQGIGDVMQYIRFAPQFQRLGARVLFEAAARLHPLLATAPGTDGLVAPGHTEAFDYYLPLLSAPAVLQTTLDALPAPASYLSADPALVAHWRDRLAGEPGFRIGIAWQGNPDFTGDYYRSAPLEKFAPLAAVPGVRLFSLQKGFGSEQLAPLAERLSIQDLGSQIDNSRTTGAFVETAAVMKNLDLVVTTDTAMAHVAGALGVPVWVALQTSPNWRWFIGRSDSPWYPSMRLFRQTKFNVWDDVFQAIAKALPSSC